MDKTHLNLFKLIVQYLSCAECNLLNGNLRKIDKLHKQVTATQIILSIFNIDDTKNTNSSSISIENNVLFIVVQAVHS